MAYGESRFSVASGKLFKRQAESAARRTYPSAEARAREALFVRMAEAGFASPPIANLASESLFRELDKIEFRPNRRRNRFYVGSDWRRLKREADQPVEATDAHLTEAVRLAVRARMPRKIQEDQEVRTRFPVSEHMIWSLVKNGQLTEKSAREMLKPAQNV